VLAHADGRPVTNGAAVLVLGGEPVRWCGGRGHRWYGPLAAHRAETAGLRV